MAVSTLAVGTFEFTAESGNTYVMNISKKGRGFSVSCSCPGFRRHNHCKHSTTVKESNKMPKNAKPAVAKVAKKSASTTRKVRVSKKENIMHSVTIAAKGKKFTISMTDAELSELLDLAERAEKVTPAAATPRRRKVAAAPVARKSKVNGIEFGVPVNLKVVGERTMRKSVILAPHATDNSLVVVKTGGRGRPGHLPVEKIEKVRALAS